MSSIDFTYVTRRPPGFKSSDCYSLTDTQRYLITLLKIFGYSYMSNFLPARKSLDTTIIFLKGQIVSVHFFMEKVLSFF